REKFAFAWNSLEKAGAHLAFGSDWEVVTMNPWPGVQVAVTRQDDNGLPAGGWVPEQRITVAQTIAGYTTGAAYSAHRETTEGPLEQGKLADLVILSQNPFEVDPHELRKTAVVLTMVGGRVVYHGPGQLDTNKPTEAKSHPGRKVSQSPASPSSSHFPPSGAKSRRRHWHCWSGKATPIRRTCTHSRSRTTARLARRTWDRATSWARSCAAEAPATTMSSRPQATWPR